jgi:hypothetical protein
MGQADDALMVLESEPNSEKEVISVEPSQMDIFPPVDPEHEELEKDNVSSKKEVTAQVLVWVSGCNGGEGWK